MPLDMGRRSTTEAVGGSSFPSLFVTGASGFVGRRLLERIPPGEFREIFCLSRTWRRDLPTSENAATTRIVEADLLSPERYLPFLASSEAVIHLAAATGRSSSEECKRVNVRGTQALVQACLDCGVRKFVHVSTIAVKFPEEADSHYRRSKAQAEAIVAASGLDYAIVRPTIVLGKESPIWRNLASLAAKPLVVLPGDGNARIQPIHVDDLAIALLEVVRAGLFTREVFEIGGSDILSIEEFVCRVHDRRFRKKPRVVHIPLAFVLPPLRAAERLAPGLLPFTAGQFASFRFDGIADDNPLFRRCRAALRGVEGIIEDIDREEGRASRNGLERECDSFCRYLTGMPPDRYTRLKYFDGNHALGLDGPSAGDGVDRALLATAVTSPFMARLVDAYSAIFRRRSLFRKKMVLLIAVIESGTGVSSIIDHGKTSTRFQAWSGLGAKGIGFLFFFCLSIVVVLPQVAMARIGPAKRGT